MGADDGRHDHFRVRARNAHFGRVLFGLFVVLPCATINDVCHSDPVVTNVITGDQQGNALRRGYEWHECLEQVVVVKYSFSAGNYGK